MYLGFGEGVEGSREEEERQAQLVEQRQGGEHLGRRQSVSEHAAHEMVGEGGREGSQGRWTWRERREERNNAPESEPASGS